ncbi:helix-turn-helix domain-containing protein, partial [Micromonospora chokoriensis]
LPIYRRHQQRPQHRPADHRAGARCGELREQVETARRMHAAGTHSVDAIAATLGVSRATVYRYLDPE